jgi:hypothetical protein
MFDTYEEKTLTTEQAMPLLMSKRAKFVKMDGEKYVIKVKLTKEEAKARKEEARMQKGLEGHKAVRDEVAEISPDGAAAPQPSALDEEVIGQEVNFEITKPKKGKRVVIVRGKIKVRPDSFGRLKDKFMFQWNKGGYFVRLDKLIEVEVKKGFRGKTVLKVRKLVYDIMYSEPLNQDGTITWDTELEEVLADSGADQYITAATFEGGFQFTPALIRAVIILGIFGGLMGIAINGTAHVVPTTLVHWVP